MLKILQARFQQYMNWEQNFQMFMLYLEKPEEPEIKLPTYFIIKIKRAPEKHLLLLYWLR